MQLSRCAQARQRPISPAAQVKGRTNRSVEGIRLRVKDLDFARSTLTIREGKGNKDRITMLPQNLAVPRSAHLEVQKHLWQER